MRDWFKTPLVLTLVFEEEVGSSLVYPGDGHVHRAALGAVHVLLPLRACADGCLLPARPLADLRVPLTVERRPPAPSLRPPVHPEVYQREVDLLPFLNLKKKKILNNWLRMSFYV